ncbi:MAG: zinc ribbon domain-containing protein [Deltaproteobacteria bacterium]|nr:zinc ribbon domain-containing protein [Deltaproteobacteria bacterium]
MPIYEFYCKKCHTIFNFFSSTVNTEKRPLCPGCKRVRLDRQMSLFSISRKPEIDEDNSLEGMDEARMESAMTFLAKESEYIDENDPRQAATLMRRLKEMTGMDLGPGIEEAIARMEAGEDPEKIEAEMGDFLDDEDSSGFRQRPARSRKYRPPQVDERIYDL